MESTRSLQRGLSYPAIPVIEGNQNIPSNVPRFEIWPEWLERKPWCISEFLEEKAACLRDCGQRVNLLAGGPPCQGFSVAGRRNGSDPRNLLFREYLKFVRILKPDVLLIENVKGMHVPFVDNGCRSATSYATMLREELENLADENGNEAGYFVAQDVVAAEDFGVPQFRPRLLTIGFAKAVFGGNSPEPFQELALAREDFLRSKGLSPTLPVTVAQALSDIARCTESAACVDEDSLPGFKEILYRRHPGSLSAYQKLMRKGLEHDFQPDSLRLVNHRDDTIKRFRKIQATCRKGVQLSQIERDCLRKGGTYVSKKHVMVALSGDQACHTLTTIPDDLLHYQQPRVHTVRENARIQSFPDWFSFKGVYTTGGERRKSKCPRYSQVGNAVPPLLAEAVGLVLRDILAKRLEEG